MRRVFTHRAAVIGWGIFAIAPGIGVTSAADPIGREPVLLIRQDGNADATNEDRADTQNRTATVFFRDSVVARDKLALAERMERLKEWRNAAELYQELLDQHADKMVTRRTNANDNGAPQRIDASNAENNRFIPVSTLVRERLSAWPTDGQEIYRSIFAARAELSLSQAMLATDASHHRGSRAGSRPESRGGSRAGSLARVAVEYPITESARRALAELFAMAFADGDFELALRLGERLLRDHPLMRQHEDRAKLITQIAAAAILNGQTELAITLARELRNEQPNARGRIGGRDVLFADWLDQVIASEASQPGDPVNPTDDLSRSARSIDPFQPAPRADHDTLELTNMGLIATEFMFPKAEPKQGEIEPEVQAISDERGLLAGTLPVARDGILYINDNRQVHALDIESGSPVLAWSATHASSNGRFSVDTTDLTRTAGAASSAGIGVQSGVALTDNLVIAILGQRPPLSSSGWIQNNSGIDPRVYALDRATGALRWSFSIDMLETQDAAVLATRPVGVPIVDGDRVFVVLRGGRSQQFEDIFLACIDVQSGNPQWVRHVLSGTSPGAGLNMGMMSGAVAPLATHPIVSGGHVIVVTELGGAVAIDILDGSVAWATAIPRESKGPVNRFPRAGDFGTDLLPAFVSSPPIVSNGRVWFVDPVSRELQSFDRSDGRQIDRFDLSPLSDSPGGPQGIEAVNADRYWLLAGQIDGNIILASDRMLVSVQLDRLIQQDQNARGITRAVSWKHPIVTATRRNNALAGRPVIVDHAILIPTATQIRRLDAKSGRHLSSYPPRDSWTGDERPGNLAYDRGKLAIVAWDRISVYGDVARLREQLALDAARNPRDPAPRLRLTQQALRSRDSAEAIRWLDEAIELSRHDPAQADAALASAWTVAQHILAESKSDRDQIDRIFDAIERASDEPAERAAAILQRARSIASLDPLDAGKLRIELLADPDLAKIQLDLNDSSLTTAGELAHAELSQLLDNRSRPDQPTLAADLRDHYNAIARARLDQAVAQNDPDILREAIERFPLADANAVYPTLIDLQHRKGRTAEAIRSSIRWISATPQSETSLRSAALNRLLEAARTLEHPALVRAAVERIDPSATLDPVRRLALLESDLPETARPSLTTQDANTAAGTIIARLDATSFCTGILEDPEVEHAGVDTTADVIFAIQRNRLVSLDADLNKVTTYEPIGRQPDPLLVSRLREGPVLVWPDAMALMNPDGSVRWTFRPAASASQQSMLVDRAGWIRASKRPPVVAQADPAPQQQNIVINIRQRNLMIRQMNNANAGNAAAVFDEDPRHPSRSSIILRVIGAGPSVMIVVMNNGRMIALDRATGTVRWDRRIVDRPPQHIVYTGATLALTTTTSSSSRLVNIDPDSGRVICEHAQANGPAHRIVNLATDGRGRIILVTQSRLLGFDTLLDPTKPTFERSLVTSNRGMPAQFSRAPGQAVAWRDLFALVIDAQSDQYRVALFDFATGEPLTENVAGRRIDVSIPLLAPGQQQPVRLRAQGAQLYAWNDRLIVSATRRVMPANDGSNQIIRGSWSRQPAPGESRQIRLGDGLMLGSDVLAVAAEEDGTPAIEVYSRQRVRSGMESGLLINDFTLNQLNNVQALRAVEGAILVNHNGQLLKIAVK
jgi:outer membrane protein assembly factor BamB